MKKNKRLTKQDIRLLIEKGDTAGLTILEYNVSKLERTLRMLPDIVLKRIVSRLISYRKCIKIPVHIDMLFLSDNWIENKLERHEVEQLIYFIHDAMQKKYKTIVIDSRNNVYLFSER